MTAQKIISPIVNLVCSWIPFASLHFFESRRWEPSRWWTKAERRMVALQIAQVIEELGELHRFDHLIQISSHKLQDWGVRLKMVLEGRREECEFNRYGILNGNPAKYQ